MIFLLIVMYCEFRRFCINNTILIGRIFLLIVVYCELDDFFINSNVL